MLIKVGDKVRHLDTGQEGVVEAIFDHRINGVCEGQPRTLRIQFPMTSWGSGGRKHMGDAEVEQVSGEEMVR